MKKHCILLLFSFALAVSPVSGQKVRNYFAGVFNPDSAAQNHFGLANYQYMYAPQGNMFTVQGLHTTLGINLARFFSKKFTLGISGDIKGFKGWHGQRLSPRLIGDFNNAFIGTYSSAEDSAKAYVLKNAIEEMDGHTFFGNYIDNIGIMFSLFPQRFGGILLQVKRGTVSFPVDGTYGNPFIGEGDSDYAYFSFHRNYLAELTFKPMAFFRNTYQYAAGPRKARIADHFLLSVYYERINLRDADINGMRIDYIVNESFIAKYETESRFGFKIGIGIY